MSKYKNIFIILTPIYLYFFIQGFYVIIYKESSVARVLAVIGMLGFTILLTMLITSISNQNKNDKNKI